MVPGFTDNEESMRRFIELIRPIWKRVDRIEILPYHTSGVEKYARLGLPYRLEEVEPMDKQKAKELEVYANKIFAQGLREERQAYAEKKQEKFTQGRTRQPRIWVDRRCFLCCGACPSLVTWLKKMWKMCCSR